MNAKSTNWLKRTRRPVLMLAGGYVAIVVVMMFLEKSLIFHPRSGGNWTPWHADVEDVWLTTSDGVQIHGWYFDHPNPKSVILFAHGNAGNLTGRADTMDRIRRVTESAVFIFDYRGYGKSQGKPDEAGILLDARAAQAWVAQRTGIAENQVTLMGRSLGTGVMVDLAASEGAKGLILESAFTSLPDTAARHYPWLPVRWVMRTRLDSAAKIDNYTGPLLMSPLLLPVSFCGALFQVIVDSFQNSPASRSFRP